MYGIPWTRVENFCASGMDAFRNACLAVASGVYDMVLACGMEKLMDQGSRGLPEMGGATGVVDSFRFLVSTCRGMAERSKRGQ
jgi:acetyl-CoA C-acetyltransferase